MNQPSSGSDDRKSVEIRAQTVDEAVARGLVRLGGLSRAEVLIEVIEEPRSGLLGFGASDALVRITMLAPGEVPERTPRAGAPKVPDAPAAVERPERPGARGGRGRGRSATSRDVPVPERTPAADPAPADRSAEPDWGKGPDAGRSDEDWGPAPGDEAPAGWDQEPGQTAAPARRERGKRAGPDGFVERQPSGPAVDPDVAEAGAIEVVSGLMERLGYGDARVVRSKAWLPDELSDDRSLVIAVDGGGCEAFLAHDLEGLRALQFVARLMLSRRVDGWVNLLIDINDDRARRVQELVDLAKQSAALVERDGRPVSLPPMSAYERRVVHIVLKDHPVVSTQSIGSGEWRKVTVRRLDQMLPDFSA